MLTGKGTMNYNKVVFVCNFSANYGGNFLASLYSLAIELKAKKKNVLFIFPLTARNKNWEIDLSHFNIAYCNLYSRDLTRVVRTFVSPSDRAIIHLHFTRAFSLPMSLKHYIHNHGFFVIHEHMMINSRFKRKLKGLLLRILGPHNSIYIGVSPAVYQQLCQEVGEEKSRLIINAIDTERLHVQKEHNNNNILIFGLDYKGKGVDLAISALLHSQLSAIVRLQIVSNNIKKTTNQIISQFGFVPSFVRIIPTSTNVSRLYNNCFLFLSPSRSESFSYAVVEAAYSGDKVIASDIAGQNTLKNIPGIKWFESENVRQLQQAIEEEYTFHIQTKTVPLEKTQNYIREHYSLKKWVHEILSIYEMI